MLGHGQEVEDPAAAVVDADDRSGSTPARRAASSPPTSCCSASSPIRTQVGRPRRDRRAHGRRDHAVDPVRAAVGEEAQPLRRLREVGLDVADRHRGADPDERPVGQLGLERWRAPCPRSRRAPPRPRCRDLRVRRAASPRASSARRARTASRPRPRAHRGSARPLHAARARRVLVGSCQAPCGSITICGDSRDKRAQRLRRGHVADPQHEAGRVRSRAKSLDAEQHVVVGDHVRAVVVAAAHARGRLGEHRPAGLRGEAGGGLGDVLGGRARRRSPRAARRRCARPRRGRRRSGARWRARAARSRAVRRRGPAQSVGSSSSRLGRERLAQREVEVHRARAGRRRPSSRRGRRARGGGWRSRGPGRGCPPPRTTWRRCRRA